MAGLVAATCQRGFSGFSGSVDGYRLGLEAFVSEPGIYMGDPLRILYLSITPPTAKLNSSPTRRKASAA